MSVITDTSASRSAETRTLGIAAAALLLVLVGYLPTLQFDYAVRDQWRAFRLPESYTPLMKLTACSRDALPFYVRSGRPLVWVGECVERAVVNDIREFRYLRLIPLAVLFATSLQLAGVLSQTVGFETTLFASTVFVLLPGFIFMTELGMNGAPVLLAVCATIASFAQFNRSAFAAPQPRDRLLRSPGVKAFALFLIACLLYPAWAFAIVPLVVIQSGLTRANSMTEKLRSCWRPLSFYACAALAYFVVVKAMVALDLFGSAHINMGDGRYEVAPTLNPAALTERVVGASSYVLDGYLWDWRIKTPLMTAGVSAFGMLTSLRTANWHSYGVPGRLVMVVIAALAGLAAVVVSMLPWLLSGMQEMNERFFVPAYLLPIVGIFAAAAAITRQLTPNRQLWAAVAACVCLVVAVGVNRITNLDVTASIVRTDFVRQQVNEWLDRRGYETEPLLLLVPPYGNHSEPRPAFIRRLLAEPDRTDTGKWSGDPNHYYYVVSAILRERADHPLGRSVGIINCGTNKVCTEKNLEQREAVFAVLSESEATRGNVSVPASYVLLNISRLTANPIEPAVKVIRATSDH